MIKDISRHIAELVDQIDNSIIGSFDPMAEVTETCRTKYARIGKPITDISENEFLITDIDPDLFIKAGNADGLLFLPKPFFISGTRIATNREWTLAEQGDLLKKTPLIWLLHDLRYFKYGRESVYEWESDIRIFFIDETNNADYYTKDHIENVVEPMSELANLFIESINKNRSYKTIESFEVINFTRFGVEESNGYVKNILDANLSGIELRINLVKYKENCKC
jgi:hypothetical protein